MSAMFKSMTVRIVDGLVLTMKRVKIVGAAGTIHITMQSTAFTQQVINVMELFLLSAWIVAISEFSERNAKTTEDVALTTLLKEWLGVSRVVPKNLNLWRDPLSQTEFK